MNDEQKKLLEAAVLSGVEVPLNALNEMNVPVNIFIEEERLGGKTTGNWTLCYEFFMPRKMSVREGGTYIFPSEQHARDAVRLFILPLYEVAFANVKGMAEGKEKSHYYWGRPAPTKQD